MTTFCLFWPILHLLATFFQLLLNEPPSLLLLVNVMSVYMIIQQESLLIQASIIFKTISKRDTEAGFACKTCLMIVPAIT